MTVAIKRVEKLDGEKYSIRLSNGSEISVACSNGALDLSGEAFSDVTGVVKSAFYGLKDLKSVKFGSAMTDIGAWAFDVSTGLASVTAPSLTEIGDGAFYGCTSLASITAPNLTEIHDDAFNGCKSLASITAPNLIWIGPGAFYGCCLLYTSPSPRDLSTSRMPSSA